MSQPALFGQRKASGIGAKGAKHTKQIHFKEGDNEFNQKRFAPLRILAPLRVAFPAKAAI